MQVAYFGKQKSFNYNSVFCDVIKIPHYLKTIKSLAERKYIIMPFSGSPLDL
jgi:hypothetical protein